MRIVVTGATGFIGTDLLKALKDRGNTDIFTANSKTTLERLTSEIHNADVVFHLAGNARTNGTPKDYEPDLILAQTICEASRSSANEQLFVLSSSVWASGAQRFKGSPYADVKARIERDFFKLAEESDSKKTVFIFRLSNVFGEKHPNKEGTAVANFCKAVSNGDVLRINDPNIKLSMCYVKDVACAFADCIEVWKSNKTLNKTGCESVYKDVSPVFAITIGDLAKKIVKFADLNDASDLSFDKASLDQRLMNVYRSYL